ncbi:ENT domain-containing protein [Hirschfeldia incana]|nr:ENT domain-containing protein [Hirschfeldia incana]
MADQKDKRMIDPLEGSHQESKPELKQKIIAFYFVLLAFRAETFSAETFSSLRKKRSQIIEQLMKEWSICQETRVVMEVDIQKNLVVHVPRVDSDAKPPTVEKQKLNQLKRKAFYAVLLAFRSETLTTGNKRTQIIEELMNEWSIAHETRVSIERLIQTRRKRRSH